MRIQALALEDGEQITQQIINQAKRRVVKTEEKVANLITGKQYVSIWKAAKKGKMSKLIIECTEVIQTLDSHLSKKMRHERAKQMSINLKRRINRFENRFENKDKTMLKLVINSIMQKYQSQQHIISAESEGEMKYGDKDVAVAITAFFETWMGSKVGVEQRWGSPGESEEEAWNNMLNMDTSKIQDAGQREFVETSYMRSFKHYIKQQEEKGIWDEVLKKILVEEVELELEARKFKAKKAQGSSGITIEMIRVMDLDNLEKIADAMNKVMRGEQVPKSWNRSMLWPLPKTDAGLHDMNKVRPIALMEIILKLLERVLFARIEKVVMDNTMLREEQY